MPALLLGSISTIADTSELQRDAFNRAFAEHGLGWTWEREEYQDLLTGNGGATRIAEYAEAQGTEVDADAVHATKSRLFQEALAGGVEARPGVLAAVRDAKAAGWEVGFVTTTSRANLEALFTGLRGTLDAGDFDLVTDVDSVESGKPSPAVYEQALGTLGEDAGACVAVEDNVGGVQSAAAAGITCVAFPNANTASHDFGAATQVAELDFSEVEAMVPANEASA